MPKGGDSGNDLSMDSGTVGLYVGVGQVALLMRYARTLKEKRKVVQSLIQRLRNQGFSVSETGYADVPQRGSLGFTYSARTAADANAALDGAERLFEGDFEVVEFNRDVFDYSGEETASFAEAAMSERYDD
jgi:uncharacterized protein YlxP (DUF503 family)